MIGAGLKRARIRKGWTLTRLAHEVSDLGLAIQPRAISELERNKSHPSAAFVLVAAAALNVPSVYFMYVPEANVTWRAFRRRSGFGKRSQEAVKQYATDIAELHIELRSRLNDTTTVEFPESDVVTHVEEAERVAGQLRKRWNIEGGPIHSLLQTAEERGAVVISLNHVGEKFDGLSGWCDEYPVIAFNSRMRTDRLRFTVAHEIGHLVMDTTDAEDSEEDLAHRFAAAFLAPAEDARRELGEAGDTLKWDNLKSLKQRYGMSMSAWIRRAHDLNIIEAPYYRALNRELRGRGWYREEPGEYLGNEEPLQLQRMARRALARGEITIERLHYSDAGFLAPVTETLPSGDYPSATELMQMRESERDAWMTKMFDLADGMEFELFEAYGEEEF